MEEEEGKKYDVFLSFCVEDSCRNFTENLFKVLKENGIQTYLKGGKAIAEDLFKAIRESKSAIVVFSEEYAFSSWCLDELVRIDQCREENRLIVFPVFCDVDPSHLRKQNGKVKDAFDKYEETFKDETQMVKKWREALTRTANISGWHLKDYRSTYPDDIRAILKDVLEQLRKEMVGMDSRIKEFEPYLNLGSEKVHMVGIWGTGGIGKTTLAEQVFKRFRGDFEARSIVYSVRETCEKETDGLNSLKKQIDEDLLSKKASMKVLIVLDDVENETQIEALVGNVGPGSRIIITTRDNGTLERCGVKDIFEVKKLTREESLMLFCQKAFMKGYPPRPFQELSNDFVRYADGLPLLLKVLGNFLYYHKTEREWIGQLNRLRETPDQGVTKVLRFSYENLDVHGKATFLDIACFFKGEDESRVKKIFRSCNFHPNTSLKVLVARSLIRVTGGKVWMHDLLQQMGWEIILKEKELGKRSRLWRHRDALRVLQDNMGTGVVEGIFLTSPGDEEIEIDPFVNMKNLRLLKICNVKFPESHDYYFSRDLILLEWHGYPCQSMMPSFQLERLVELIMPNSRLEQLWPKTTRLENLVLINLSYCKELTETPDFDFIPNLETLILEGCESLAELHPSIGRLEHLALLNLRGCQQLTSLPKSISLKSLATLILSYCSNLTEFPEIEGDMEKLSVIHLEGTAIKELPTSFNRLTGLILLKLENCKKLLSLGSGILPIMKSLKTCCLVGCESMYQLPEDLRRFENLEHLCLRGTAIRTLPSSIVHLKHLKGLSMRGCGVEQLPDEIGLLSSLQELDLGENSFSSIPTSISKLSELRGLSVSKCSKLQSLPKHLPINLLDVHARDCPMLTDYSDTEITIWTSNKGFYFIDRRNSSNVNEDCTYDTKGFPFLVDFHNSSNVDEDWTYAYTPLPMPHDQVDSLLPQYIKKQVNDGDNFEIRFPSTTIPLWCQNWDTRSPIKIELSGKDHEDSGHKTKGFALFVIFEIKKHDNFDEAWQLKNIFCHVALNRHHEKTIRLANFKNFRVGTFGVCCYVPHKRFPWQLNTPIHKIEVYFATDRLDVELQKFGVHQVFEHNVEEFAENLAHSVNDHLDQELNFSRHCKVIFDVANQLVESGNFTRVKHKIRQGESSLRVPQNGVQSNRTAWDTIPTIEHKCYINGTYKLLSELLQGYVARHSPFQFVLPFPILSPWFFHHSVGNTAVCYLPPNICNDERWLGLELYVHCERLGFCPGEIVLDVDLYAHGRHPLPIYSCQHKTRNGNFIAIHVPREYFSKELNDCEGISAIFEPTTPDVEVKMCGTRLLYVQDSKLLSKGIIESIFGRPDLLLYLNKTVKGFLQKDKSDGDWCSRMTTRELRERERVVLKSSQKLLTSTEQVAKEVSTLLDKHRKECYEEGGTVDETSDSFVVHSKKSFLKNWDLIQQDTNRNLSFLFNHVHIMAESLLHTRDSKKLIKTLEDLLGELFKHRILVTLSLKGHIAFVLEHFDPFSPYNLCFPQKGIPEWFDHQCRNSVVGIELPPNLYDDKSWRGLVMCAAFSIKEHSGTFSKASFRLLCHLESKEGCLNPIAHCSISKDKIKWVHLRGFIWLTYIPRVLLTELDGKRIVVARVYNYCPGLIVDKCGIRLLYEKDVKGLKKTITECCTSFVKDLESIDQFLKSEDYEDLPSDDQTL